MKSYGLFKLDKTMLILILIITSGLLLRLDIGSQKKYFYHDGILTLELINGDAWAPQRVNPENYNHIVSGSIFKKDVSTTKTEALNYNFTNALANDDIHPPLYYWILHPLQGLIADGEVSWWPGLILNFTCYILTAFLVFKIASLFIKEKYFTILPVVFLSFSPSLVSSDMFLRMYSLLGVFSLLLIYSSLKISQSKEIKTKYFLTLFLSFILGVLTHYYFIILSLMTYVLIINGLYIKGYYKHIKLYTITAFLSALVFFIIWPHIFKQIFETKVSKLVFDVTSMHISILQSYNFINDDLFSGIFMPGIVLMLIIYLKNFKTVSYNLSKVDYLKRILFILSTSFFIIIMTSAPYTMESGGFRYFYIPSLIFIICFSILISYFIKKTNIKKQHHPVFLALIGICFCLLFDIKKVSYLFIRETPDSVVIDNFQSETSSPVFIKVRDNWKGVVFEDTQRDWTIVNVMPYIYNKNQVFIIDDPDFTEDKLKNTLHNMKLGNEVYLLSTRKDPVVKVFNKHFSQSSDGTKIRYRYLYKYTF